jgi:Gas vesicle synthesis protein GvpL/GvpF
MSAKHATWVYAVTRELDPAVLAGVDGIGGAQVRALADDGLAAAISTVDADASSAETHAALAVRARSA